MRDFLLSDTTVNKQEKNLPGVPSLADSAGVIVVDAESERAHDLILVRRILAGEREAYRVIVDRYQRRLLSLAFEIVKQRQDAEDIVQEAFVKAYLSLKDFRGESSVSTWLYRIVVNMALDYQRRTTRRGTPQDFDERRQEASLLKGNGDLPGAGQRERAPDQILSDRELATQLKLGLNEISPVHRAVVMLREVDGLSYDEISEVLNISKGTVMSRLHYARKRLQQLLSSWRNSDDNGKGDKLANGNKNYLSELSEEKLAKNVK